MTIEQEVPEMNLTALLDNGAFTQALSRDVPCQQEDPELWFAETPDDVEFAKALCGTCPVQDACFKGALARREPWGVWGGQLFIGGTVVARKRPRGRPRKDAAAVAAATAEHASAEAARVLAGRAS
ncbi:MAG: WhiB family transcriptional regulator [Actinomycetales bacterium]|nr:WhiB family transcriptional regulator [Actinomycetales bacterium]